MRFDTSNWRAIDSYYRALLSMPLTAQNVSNWLLRWSGLEAQLKEDTGNAASRFHENMADEEAEKRYLHYVREILPQVEVARQKLMRRLLEVDYNPPPNQQIMIEDFRARQSLFREENVSLQTECELLSNQYRKITGQMTIGWQSQTLTQQEAALLLTSPEDEQRRAAWHAIHTCWLEKREVLDQLYLEMLALRNQIAGNADLPSYRDYVWLQQCRHDYKPEDLFIFHDAIEREVVPVAQQILETRRVALGVPRLRPWDLEVEADYHLPLQPFQQATQLEEGCARIFHALDSRLGQQFNLLRHGYLDLGSRPNKASGAYCRILPISQRSYIFMNAVGQHDDVQALLHESGHAFHNFHTADLPLIWMRYPPMEMAEVASMSMELLANPYLSKEKGGFYNKADALRARIKNLEQSVLFLPYIAVVDAFQHWAYSQAGITAQALNQKWAQLWDRFMVGVDWEGLEIEAQTGWHRKRHIFIKPFYYIEYGLAQVAALQLWRRAQYDQARALKAYRYALSLGATRSLPELYESAGIPFRFDASTLRELMSVVSEKLYELRRELKESL